MLPFLLLALSVVGPGLAKKRAPAQGLVLVDCPGEVPRTVPVAAGISELGLSADLPCRVTRVEQAPAAPEDVVVTVQGRPVTAAAFEHASARKTWLEGQRAETAQEIVDGLVADELLYQRARAAELELDPKVQKVMVNTLLRDQVYGQVRNADFTDRELEAYYEAHRADFVVPHKRQLKIITLTDRSDRDHEATRAALVKLRAELTPDNFKELALERSEDPYRRRGGDWGFVSAEGKPGLAQAAVEAGFAVPLSSISEPVDIGAGWALVHPSSEREAVERTYQQMKGSVLRKVKNDRLKELYEAYVAGLRQEATIEVNQARVDQLAAEAKTRTDYDFGGSSPPGISIGIGDYDEDEDDDDDEDEDEDDTDHE